MEREAAGTLPGWSDAAEAAWPPARRPTRPRAAGRPADAPARSRPIPRAPLARERPRLFPGDLLEVLLRPGPDPSSLSHRDPAFIRAVLPYLEAVTTTLFRPTVEGAGNIPSSGPSSPSATTTVDPCSPTCGR